MAAYTGPRPGITGFPAVFGTSGPANGWRLARRELSLPVLRRGAGAAVRRIVPSMRLSGAGTRWPRCPEDRPVLATVVVTSRSGTVASGVAMFLAYAAGMGLVVEAVALAVALSRGSLVGPAAPIALGRLIVRRCGVGDGSAVSASSQSAETYRLHRNPDSMITPGVFRIRHRGCRVRARLPPACVPGTRVLSG